jgi:hypothetical protein
VVPPAGNGYYSRPTIHQAGTEKSENKKESREYKGESFSDMMKRFGRFCAKIVNKGNNNYFEAKKNDSVIISCPVTALVILLIFLFWVIVPLVIIGLFFGFRYSFRGEDLGKDSVNKVMDGATDTAEDIKKSFSGEKK